MLEATKQGNRIKSKKFALTKFGSAKIGKQTKAIKIELSQGANGEVKDRERAVIKRNMQKRETITRKISKSYGIKIEDHQRKIGERKSIEID